MKKHNIVQIGPLGAPQGDVPIRRIESLTPGGKKTKLPKIPLRLNGSAFDLRNHPPGIGEGSLEIYREIGLADHEIRDLHNEGIIEISDAERSSAHMDESAA